MNLNSLKLFNTLASELSFSKTASLLYISQPAVSIQLKKLEEELGFKLIEKSNKSLQLTAKGILLYDYTKRIFSLVDEMESVLHTENMKGLVAVAASNTPGAYILPEILGDFKKIFPSVATNLHIGNTHEIARMVSENRVDFAVNGGDIVYNDKIHVERLAEDDVIFVTSPANNLAGREDVEPSQLKNSKYITHEKSSMLYKLMEDIFCELQLPADIIMTLGHSDAIKRAVALDLGISALPSLTVKAELSHGLLKQFKIKGRSWSYPYSLVYHKDRHQSPASKNLMALIREKMKHPVES